MRTRQRDCAADARCGVIATALAELGTSPEQMSLELGLDAGYLHAFIEAGRPLSLPNRLRRRLAAYLGVPEQSLR